MSVSYNEYPVTDLKNLISAVLLLYEIYDSHKVIARGVVNREFFVNGLVGSCITTLILTAYVIACIPITSLSENMLTIQAYIFYDNYALAGYIVVYHF